MPSLTCYQRIPTEIKTKLISSKFIRSLMPTKHYFNKWLSKSTSLAFSSAAHILDPYKDQHGPCTRTIPYLQIPEIVLSTRPQVTVFTDLTVPSSPLSPQVGNRV